MYTDECRPHTRPRITLVCALTTRTKNIGTTVKGFISQSGLNQYITTIDGSLQRWGKRNNNYLRQHGLGAAPIHRDLTGLLFLARKHSTPPKESGSLDKPENLATRIARDESHVSTFECTRKQENRVTYTTSKANHGFQVCLKLLE